MKTKQKRIQISFNGRFGNQLFQYAVAKAYAKKYDYILEIPKNWIGREIFENVKDPIIEEEYIKHNFNVIPQNKESYIRLDGYFESQKAINMYSKQDVLWWFKLKEKYDYPKIKDYYIVAHLRRGDLMNLLSSRCIIAKICYKVAIINNNYDLNNVIWVGENIKQSFYEEFNIPEELYFLYDFLLLKNADVIFRSNSTFSWWSAALSNAQVFSPVIDNKVGWNHQIKFVEGNHPIMLANEKGSNDRITLYLKNNKQVLYVPSKYQICCHNYPAHNKQYNIETYFYEHCCKNNIPNNYIYLPIFWTNYYVKYGFKKSKEINKFLKSNIDINKKYFTIVQSDYGILEDISNNVLVFGSGGKGNVPIPLLCDKHPVKEDANRDILCSFVGVVNNASNNKNQVRTKMFNALKDNKDFVIKEANGNTPLFEDLMNRSIFSLCPRGYGKTSFRLYEAIQMGSIPIYIYDDIWLPYKDELDWSEFSILLHINDIEKLPSIINKISDEKIKEMRLKLKEVYEKWFNWESVSLYILNYLKN